LVPIIAVVKIQTRKNFAKGLLAGKMLKKNAD
jgi:hypothetical protein